MVVHAALTSQGQKSVKSTTLDAFLRRVNFILMLFREELTPLLSAGKPRYFQQPRKQKSQNFPLGMNHGMYGMVTIDSD